MDSGAAAAAGTAQVADTAHVAVDTVAICGGVLLSEFESELELELELVDGSGVKSSESLSEALL